MKKFLIALQFLTVFPLKVKSEIKNRDFGGSLLYFPLVGLLLGALLFLAAAFFYFLPNFVRGSLILIIYIILTGGIHLDGFADTCDGLYGNKPKEEILKIMRDSHIGAMGVIGLILLLLLKFSFIVSLPEAILWKALIEMAVFGRWSQVLACTISDYPRQDGKAKYFIEYASKKDLIIGSAFSFALFLFIAKLQGALLFILAFICTLISIQYIKRRIGGMTGDTVGAVSELAEIFVLFFILILSR